MKKVFRFVVCSMGLHLPCVLALLLVLLGLEKRVGGSRGLDGAENSSSVSPAELEGPAEQCLQGAGWTPPCPSERPTTTLAQGGRSTVGALRTTLNNGPTASSPQLLDAESGWVHFVAIFLLTGAALTFIYISCRVIWCFRNQLRLQEPVRILNEQLQLGQLERPDPAAAADATAAATALAATATAVTTAAATAATAATSAPSVATDSTQKQSQEGDQQ